MTALQTAAGGNQPDTAARWQGTLGALIDLWLSRRWQPDPALLAQWQGLRPAVVVTGASEGLGLAIARRFARRSCPVVLVARRRQALEQAVKTIRGEDGGSAIAIPLDVSGADAAGHLDVELARNGLYADILVNNAGIGLGGDYLQHSPRQIAELLEVNVRALSVLMRHFLPGMCARGRGGVLNVASLGGYTPGPYQAAYYASKAYVIALTEAVAWETRGLGVRVAVYAPGPINTRLHAKMGAESALYRWLIPAPSPWTAAGSAVRWFAWGRTVITPGLLAPLLAIAMRLTPHPVLIPIVAGLLRPRESSRNARQ
jgi:short-subunit dehydrogenase